jgi:serine/threonine protein kinase/Flp pilus assembly protein TadD
MPNSLNDDELVIGLVELTLTRPPEEREAYLLSSCAHDAGLREKVWGYVQAEQRMKGFLLEPLFSFAPDASPLRPDQVLEGRFRIVREIGQGGMGVVYEALDDKLGRRIAIKCAKAGFHKRLPPEVRNASDISHPNVCRVFEIHTASTPAGEIDFLTMEFLEGPTLAERLQESRLPETEAKSVAHQLCAGLEAAHRQGVIHGDLKSNNVVLVKSLDGVRAVITDFGLAGRSFVDEAGMQSGSMGAGAPAYMAPELLKGEKPSVASDIYALGVILYELASGRRPFNESTTWEQRLSERPSPLHHRWDRILATCLDPDPSRRFRSVAEVERALGPSRVRKRLIAVAAALAVAVASGTLVYREATTPEAVRLAVLPFESDTNSKALIEGVVLDASNRLNHLKSGRTRLTLIPLSDAVENKVDEPAKAGRMLGANYALQGTLQQESGRVHMRAYITDTRSLVRLKEWQGEYSANEVGNAPMALAGFVTGTLRLPPMAIAPVVRPAAYHDWAEGVSLSQRDDTVDRALPLLTKAVDTDPDSPLTHAKLAEAQWLKFLLTHDQKWADLAAASLKNAELRNPDIVPVWMVSGLMRDYFGQYPQAQEDLTRATELEPLNGDAWRRLALVYEHNRQFSLALAAYRKAIEVQPQYFKNYRDLASYYFNQGDYEEAIQEARKMIALAPDLAAAHYAVAASYLNLGRYSDAELELLTARQFQETANVIVGLGLVYSYQGRDSEAIPYFERAIAKGPVTSVLYMNLGTALRRAGFQRESKQAYRSGLSLAASALEQNFSSGSDRAILAYLCARLDQRDRAASEALQALNASRGSNDVRWLVAQTYEALGQRDRTIEVLRDAPYVLLDRLSRHPDLADLRTDSRFQQLVVAASKQAR